MSHDARRREFLTSALGAINARGGSPPLEPASIKGSDNMTRKQHLPSPCHYRDCDCPDSKPRMHVSAGSIYGGGGATLICARCGHENMPWHDPTKDEAKRG